jgi:alkaline phosphatase
MENKSYVSYKDKYNTKYGYKNGESHDLEEIAKDTGVSIKGLQQIYNKGIGAYKTNPQSVRPNVKSKEQWAMARVYSAVMGGKASKIDSNELKMNLGGNVHIGESIEFYERTYADGTKERFSIEDYEKNIYPLLEKDFSRFVNGGGVGKMNYADGRKFRIRVKQKKG